MGKNTKAGALVTRARILDTAEQLFETNGVSKTGLEDVARAAAVTRGAIYGHFKSKGELVVAMYDRVRPVIDRLMEDEGEDLNDPLGQLHNMMAVMFKTLASSKRDQRVLTIMIHKCELTEDMHELLSRSRQIAKMETQRRRWLIRRAIKLGQLPNNLDLKRAENMFQGLMVGIITNWTRAPRSFSLRREADLLVAGYIDMLRLSPALRRNHSKP